MAGHFVYFSPLDSKIRFWEDADSSQVELRGKAKLDFGREKSCIGYNDGEKMRPCQVRASGSRQCGPCAARDVSRVYTRLDHAGFERFYEKFRNQEFSVYLASVGHLVKCGVTRSARLLERVREQGADCFSEIAKTDDAETAYSIEALIQNNFAVRNSITIAQKMKLMNCADSSRLTDCVSKIRESKILEDYYGEMEVRKLDYFVPPSFSEAENIDGRICGNKGQVLFFEKEGSHYAVNMGKKIGTLFSYSLPPLNGTVIARLSIRMTEFNGV